MNLKLEIRRNADGVIETDTWPNWEWHNWIWEEGNFSCDCNRGLFFFRARGEETEGNDCGEGKFSIRCSDADTGEVLYDEFGKTA